MSRPSRMSSIKQIPPLISQAFFYGHVNIRANAVLTPASDRGCTKDTSLAGKKIRRTKLRIGSAAVMPNLYLCFLVHIRNNQVIFPISQDPYFLFKCIPVTVVAVADTAERMIQETFQVNRKVPAARQALNPDELAFAFCPVIFQQPEPCFCRIDPPLYFLQVHAGLAGACPPSQDHVGKICL